MGPILLLTKNVLAEEETQKKLRHPNYEVFSSKRPVDEKGTQGSFFNSSTCSITRLSAKQSQILS